MERLRKLLLRALLRVGDQKHGVSIQRTIGFIETVVLSLSFTFINYITLFYSAVGLASTFSCVYLESYLDVKGTYRLIWGL